MDYYEELGLRRTATVKEIRQAYKVMARLVHPDGQAQDSVREMAERQMKRLNEILAILTNEESRQEYDAGLLIAVSPPANGAASAKPNGGVTRPVPWPRGPQPQIAPRSLRIPDRLQPVAEHWFWVALGLVVVAVGVWYAAQVGADPAQLAVSAPVSGGQPLAPGGESHGKRSDGAAYSVNGQTGGNAPGVAPSKYSLPPADPDGDDPTAPAGIPVAAPDSPWQTPASQTPPPVPDRPTSQYDIRPHANEPQESSHGTMPSPIATGTQEPFSLAPAGKEDSSRQAAAGSPQRHTSALAGNWLLVPDPLEKVAPGTYPATYVELLLAEDRGQMWGSYRAQYAVRDRAVLPEVTFQVRGESPAGTSANFKWTAADGAKGEVELALTGPNTIKVTWWTTEFGRHQTLASGMAKLVRQQVR